MHAEKMKWQYTKNEDIQAGSYFKDRRRERVINRDTLNQIISAYGSIVRYVTKVPVATKCLLRTYPEPSEMTYHRMFLIKKFLNFNTESINICIFCGPNFLCLKYICLNMAIPFKIKIVFLVTLKYIDDSDFHLCTK